MSSKPKIFGFCDAGSKYETVHKEDFLASAAIFKLNPETSASDPYYKLLEGYTYKIKGVPQSAWDTSLLMFIHQTAVGGWAGKKNVQSFPEYDKYSDITVRLLAVASSVSGSTRTTGYDYEINGNRYNDIITYAAGSSDEPATYFFKLSSEYDVYLVNSDAQILADKTLALEMYNAVEAGLDEILAAQEALGGTT